MKRNILIFLAILFTSLGKVSYAEQIAGSYYSSGPWQGAAYTDQNTGEFLYCDVFASYAHNSTSLYFYLNKNYTMTIGVYDSLGRFPIGENFPVTLTVDRRPPFFGTANAVSQNSAFVTLPQMASALDAMKKGRMLSIDGLYGNLSYALNGTFKALDAAYRCAGNYYNFKRPVSSPSDSPTSNDRVWQPSRQQERIMFQLASEIATDLGQSKIQFRNDTNGAVIWDSEDGSMWVSAAVGRNQGAKVDLAVEFGLDMGNLNEWCSGDLATVQREFSVSGVSTTETDASCHSDEAGHQFRVHIIRQVIEGELYELVLYFDGNGNDGVKSNSQPDSSISTAAATILASYSVED